MLRHGGFQSFGLPGTGCVDSVRGYPQTFLIPLAVPLIRTTTTSVSNG